MSQPGDEAAMTADRDQHVDAEDNDLSMIARALGQRGGRQTKRRGSAYFARIGRLGAQKRWHSRDQDDAAAAEQAAGELDDNERSSPSKRRSPTSSV